MSFWQKIKGFSVEFSTPQSQHLFGFIISNSICFKADNLLFEVELLALIIYLNEVFLVLKGFISIECEFISSLMSDISNDFVKFACP